MTSRGQRRPSARPSSTRSANGPSRAGGRRRRPRGREDERILRTGADISHHQPSFNADAYYQAEDFLIHKATEAGGYVDPTFEARWRAAGPRPRAAYHFARPGAATVDEQADHFLATVRRAGWHPGLDAWALDFEDAGGFGPAALVIWAERWIGRVRAALGGRGLFYAYPRFVIEQMGDPGRVPGGCLAWVARYRVDGAYAPLAGLPAGRPKGWPDPPDVWQCTNGVTGCVHDVPSVGRCDWNRATDQAFAELFGGDDMALSADDKQWIVDTIKVLVTQGDDPGTGTPDTHPNNLERIRKELGDLSDQLDAAELAILDEGQLAALADRLAPLIAGKLVIAGHPAMTGTVTLHPEEPTP